jgi:flotillin
VQTERIEQVKLQLEADKIKPASARRQELVENARGRAAKVVEEGKATAEALRQLARTWASSGDSARQILVAQKLSGLVEQLMSTVSALPIDKVTVIDRKLSSGDNVAVRAAVTSEQLKHAIGVDVPQLLNRIAGKGEASEPPRPWTPPADAAR